MKIIFLVVATVIINSRLQAQDSLKLLNQVIVTATKFPTNQYQTGKATSIITKDQIEKSAGKTVAQVLNEQAGITINGAYNSLGTVQTLYVRGASSGRTLILLDGVPINDPSMINNEFDLNLLSINDVEKIEICKGAQSTLYGSDAIAGVINIITVMQDVNKPFNLKATTSYGSFFKANFQVYGKIGKLTYITRFAKLKTNGFSAANDSTSTKNFDKDGYNGQQISVALNYQIKPTLLLKTFINKSQYKADIDAGPFADEKDFTIKNSALIAGVGAIFKKGKLNIIANYKYAELYRNYKNDSIDITSSGIIFESNKYAGRTQFVELLGNINVSKYLIFIAGVDYNWSNMNQQYYVISNYGPYKSTFPDTSLNQHSYYTSLLINNLNKKFNVEIGGRLNYHSRYGSSNTFTFNPSYTLNKNCRIFGSIASGYKAPSIYQLFDVYSGNISLQPEKSINYEVGLQQSIEKINSRIVFFKRNIKNGLDYNYVNYHYYNFVKQNVNGLEIELQKKLNNNINITANYTFIKGSEETENRTNTKDTTYNYLLRRPKSNVNINISYQIKGNLYIKLGGKWVSNRYDVGGFAMTDVLLKNYLLLNGYTEYNINNNIKIFVDVQNITNKKFVDIRGYNSMPILINGGITFKF